MSFKIERKNKTTNFYELKEFQDKYKASIDNLYPYAGIKINSRTMIIGPSGAGKSNAVMNIIKASSEHKKGCFKEIHLLHKIDESLYDFLEDKLKTGFKCYKNIKDFPDVIELNEEQHKKKPEDRVEKLVIFDDFCFDAKKDLEKLLRYAQFSRKRGITCVYLTQSFYATEYKLRQQMNNIILLSIPNKLNLEMIIRGFAIPLNIDNVKKLLQYCLSFPLEYLKIGLDANVPIDKKFSCGLIDYFDISDMIKEQEEEEELEKSKKKKVNKKSKKKIDESESDDDDYDARLIELLGRNWKN